MASRSSTVASSLDEKLQKLELATREVEALPADEGLELIRADLQLARRPGPGIHAGSTAAPAAGDGLDPGHDLFGVAGLGDPVVGAESQPANALGDSRALGADDHAELRQRTAHLLEVCPCVIAENPRVDDEGVELHRDQLSDRHRAGERGGAASPRPRRAWSAR